MRVYPEEQKKAVIRKWSQSGLSLRQFAKQEGLSPSTLCAWRNKYLEGDVKVEKSKGTDNWSVEQKFSVVVETATLSEIELSKYCREKGLYPEQVQQWKQSCISGNETDYQQRQKWSLERKSDQKRIKELEKELRRKEAALAETAALLVLRKKFDAWQREDGEC